MIRWLAGLIAVVSASGFTPEGVAWGADLTVPHRVGHIHYRAHECGCCGCLHTSYVYHPELRSTYGTGMDPRNFDQTEPYYFYGAVRRYPRYWPH